MKKGLSGGSRRTGWNGMEMQIAFHCAPLIAGLKRSNLLTVPGEDLNKMKSLLQRTGISYFVVADVNEKTVVLLFDREELEDYIRRPDVWQIFQRRGYLQQELGRTLYVFRLRYESYLRGRQGFPHEMGLLLGYPVEDVKGFIGCRGEDCLYTGDWKVYGNLSEKIALFREFESARDALAGLLADGFGIVEIIQKCLLKQRRNRTV